MSEPQVTMNGPARLRQSADLGSLFPDELRQLAALWEADLERAARDHDLAMSIMAERLTRAEAAEAALERARALADKLDLIVADWRYRCVWDIAQQEIGPYKGPTWEVELLAFRAALAEGAR